jgi:anti-sigma B factor antagonist
MSISFSALAGARAGHGAAPPMRPPFAVSQRRDGAVYVLALAGELDLFSAPRLREAIARADRDVVLDLTQVGFVDSSGLAAILGAARRLATAGRRLSLVAGAGYVRALLERTGLIGPLEVFASLAGARAAHRAARAEPDPLHSGARRSSPTLILQRAG